jgi:hypothetical protein
MKAGFFAMAMLLVMAAASPAAAEFYRYVDEHGNVLYTDDLSKVPLDQRQQVTEYEESRSAPAPPAPLADEPKQPATGQAAEAEQERQRLEEQSKNLNREYDELMSERTKLNDMKKEAITPAQIKDYNRQIVEFNARIKSYEEKRDAHASEVQSFKDRTESKPPTPQKQ